MIDHDLIVEMRLFRPQGFVEAASRRRPRGMTNRLMLIAADHTARNVFAAGGRPFVMADRHDLLARLVTALDRPGVDGVLATADILEDLLILGALEGKVVIASMNRGGLQGSAWEADDPFTAYDADAIQAMRFTGGKMLVRMDLSDRSSLRTIEAAARAVNDLANHRLLTMIEPFLASAVDGRLVNDLSPDAMIRAISIVTAFGRTSRNMWLKLPLVEDMPRVLRSTTVPAVLLGGDPTGPLDASIEKWSAAMALPGIFGLAVGRAVLYPADDDVAGAVDKAAAVVYGSQ